MSKSLSFLDAVVATAIHKRQAAQTRRLSNPEAEKPRDVILNACERIAARLAGDGFVFLRSGPTLKRTDGDLVFHIHFQSDRNNMAGRRAAVWIHGGVRSITLGKWRRAHPMPWGGSDGPDAGLVTGGQIGNLTTEPTWLEWDFADKSRRETEVEDAVRAIRRIILPFFALFDDPARAFATLIHYPVLRQSSLMEYALAVLGRDQAEAAGRTFLSQNPVFDRHFRLALAKFREQGLPGYISGEANDLAAVALAADLDLSPRRD